MQARTHSATIIVGSPEQQQHYHRVSTSPAADSWCPRARTADFLKGRPANWATVFPQTTIMESAPPAQHGQAPQRRSTHVDCRRRRTKGGRPRHPRHRSLRVAVSLCCCESTVYCWQPGPLIVHCPPLETPEARLPWSEPCSDFTASPPALRRSTIHRPLRAFVRAHSRIGDPG